MLGIRKYFEAQSHLATKRGLRQAALFYALRQENYIALMNMHGTKWDLSKLPMPHDPVEHADAHIPDDELEFTWANCIVIKCSHILQYCYGPRSEQSGQLWNALNDYNDRWLQLRPLSFKPVFRREARNDSQQPLPMTYYTQDWQGMSPYINDVQRLINEPQPQRLNITTSTDFSSLVVSRMLPSSG